MLPDRVEGKVVIVGTTEAPVEFVTNPVNKLTV